MIVALFLVGMLILAALVVDLGFLYHTKRELQTAADAAALAGAWELPNAAAAESVAFSYAGSDEATAGETDPTTPYDGDPTRIEVVCTRTVPPTFSRRSSRDTRGRRYVPGPSQSSISGPTRPCPSSTWTRVTISQIRHSWSGGR